MQSVLPWGAGNTGAAEEESQQRVGSAKTVRTAGRLPRPRDRAARPGSGSWVSDVTRTKRSSQGLATASVCRTAGELCDRRVEVGEAVGKPRTRREDGLEAYLGRIWVALLLIALTVVVVTQVNALAPIEVGAGEAPFRKALSQLGILYIVALFVERSLEVLIKAWRQSGKSGLEQEVRTAEDSDKADAEKNLQAYRAGTQRRALLIGLTIGVLVSLSALLSHTLRRARVGFRRQAA